VIKGAGGEVMLEVTQIGKECLKPCSIYYQMGSCIMPKEGIFCRVLEAGSIKKGNSILSGDDI
jgi:MOSC domain-containing protein YiiM